MSIRAFLLIAALVLAACNQAAAPAGAVRDDTDPPVLDGIDVSNRTPLNDDELADFVRGATTRGASAPSYWSDSYGCTGGWFSSGGTVPIEGDYSIENSLMCHGHGGRVSCARYYRVGDTYYRRAERDLERDNPLDEGMAAGRVIVTRRQSCGSTRLDDPVALSTAELRRTLVGATIWNGEDRQAYCESGVMITTRYQREPQTSPYEIENDRVCSGGRCFQLFRRGASHFIRRGEGEPLAPTHVSRPREGNGC